MKKILFVLVLALSWMGVSAQDGELKRDWLLSFTSIEVDGPIDLTLIQVPDSVAPRIVYGDNSLKFEAVVKNKVLYIKEKNDSRRNLITNVTVYFSHLDNIDAKQATVNFKAPLKVKVLDVYADYKANITLPLEVIDLNLVTNDQSVVTLVGTAKYLTANAMNSTVDASQVDVVSADVNASTNAKVILNVSERLVARTTTKAVVTYSGDPEVIRGGVAFMGGGIGRSEK